MNLTTIIASGAAVALAASVTAGAAAAPTAKPLGTTSLAEVLTSDGNQFDKNGKDFDIVTEAVLAVLAAKPDSPVKILTNGKKRLTAFAPKDRAFKILASALTGSKVRSESKAFDAVAGLGIDTVEQVLLYHVVPGQPITAKQALHADDARLETALGKNIQVRVVHLHSGPAIFLRDKDPDFKDPRVVVPDVNKGNRQIAHGINRVLLPTDL